MVESMEYSYEQLLEDSGGFGRYQFLSYIWCCLCNLLSAGPVAFMIFGGIFPHKINNCSTNFFNTSTYTINTTTEVWCEENVYTFPSVVQEWNLTGDRKYIYGTIVALEMCGILIGALCFSPLPDRFGRKPVLLVGILFQGAAGIGSGVSNSWQLFAAMFFLYGLSFGVLLATRFALFVEVTVQRWRLLSYFPGPPVGFLLLAVFAGWISNDWRELMLWCQAPVPFVIFMTLYPIMESPKWLLDSRRVMKFKKTIAKIRKWNRIQFELDPNVIEVMSQSGNPTNLGKQYSIVDIFRRKSLSFEVLSLALVWFTGTVSQHSIFLNLGNVTAGNIYLNVIVMMAFRILLVNIMIIIERNTKRLGRKLMVQVCQMTIFASMILSCIYYLASSYAYVNPMLLQVSLGLAVGCLGIIWPALEMITSESIPTEVRATGHGFCVAVGCAGSIIAPYIALIHFLWKPGPYLSVGMINLISCILVSLIMSETKGKGLPSLTHAASKRERQSRIGLERLSSRASLLSEASNVPYYAKSVTAQSTTSV